MQANVQSDMDHQPGTENTMDLKGSFLLRASS